MVSGGTASVNYMDYGFQLGRRFRALKAWMVFRAFGRTGLVSRVREHCRLAQCWASWVDADPLFERMAPVHMAVVCFRVVPLGLDNGRCDRLNEAIVDAVNHEGSTYLTHTRIDGRTVMRIGIGNILTTERHLEAAWQRILDHARRLCSGFSAP